MDQSVTSLYPVNYHTHSCLDDGIGTLEEYVREAVSKGFSALGFSGHPPLAVQDDDWRMSRDDMPFYFAEIERLKSAYASQIEVYAGIEADYLEVNRELAGSEYRDRLDYLIGSVHCMFHPPSGTYLSVDGPPEEFSALLADLFAGDIRRMAAHYFQLQMRMVREHSVDIIGHCTLLEKHNRGGRYFDSRERWYQELASEFLSAVRESGAAVEINTGAIARGYTDAPYPDEFMLRRCVELDIPLVLSSDAHAVQHLDCWYARSVQLAAACGCRNLRILSHGRWQDMPLSLQLTSVRM
jgi:histidinol-phosphatase (PHP family)